MLTGGGVTSKDGVVTALERRVKGAWEQAPALEVLHGRRATLCAAAPPRAGTT